MTEHAAAQGHDDLQLTALSLTELRHHRDELRAEEAALSYWRQVVHAGLEQSGAVVTARYEDRADQPVRWPVAQPRLPQLPPCPELPGRRELLALWAGLSAATDAHHRLLAAARLWQVERVLCGHRLLVHARLDEATDALVGRFCARPESALDALSEQLLAGTAR